jgi:hypothetical protein
MVQTSSWPTAKSYDFVRPPSGRAMVSIPARRAVPPDLGKPLAPSLALRAMNM